MFHPARTGDPAGGRATDPGRARSDLGPDEANLVGPDAPNTREDDSPGGPVTLEAPPPEPPSTALDHGDFAPDV